MNLNDFEYLQNEMRDRTQVIVDATFPPRSDTYQHLLEYRIKLTANSDLALYGGDSMKVMTNCFIKKDAMASLYIKANPDLVLLCEERYVKCEDQHLSVKVFNIYDKLIRIPKDVCIAYLIVKI